MKVQNLSRRSFVGGLAAALAYFRSLEVTAQQRGGRGGAPGQAGAAAAGDAKPKVPSVRLSSNENPYGIAESVKQAIAA